MVERLLRGTGRVQKSQPFVPGLSGRRPDSGIAARKQRDIDRRLFRYTTSARFPRRRCFGIRWSSPDLSRRRRCGFLRDARAGRRDFLCNTCARLCALDRTPSCDRLRRLASSWLFQCRRFLSRHGSLLRRRSGRRSLLRRATRTFRPTRLLSGHGCASESADAAAMRHRRVLLRARAGSTQSGNDSDFLAPSSSIRRDDARDMSA